MNIWLDNTGLQSAGRALARSGSGQIDVDGLLQLVTLLVFAEHLSVNGFERELVSAQTCETQQRLLDIGLPASVLAVTPVSTRSYSEACVKAAARAASDLQQWGFKPGQHAEPGLKPDRADKGKRSAREFLDLVKGGRHIPSLREALDELRDQKATAAVRFMIVASDHFQTEVGKVFGAQPRWSSSKTDKLNAFARFYLNNALAEQHHCVYSPAVARARIVRTTTNYVVERLETGLTELSRKLIGRTLAVPPVAAALLQRARGEPKALIHEALSLRESSGPLRKDLTRLVRKADPLTPKGRQELRETVDGWIEVVRKELGLAPRPTLHDALDVALDVHFILGFLPLTPSIDPKKLVAWARHCLAARRVAVLTEISRRIEMSDKQERAYERLCRICVPSL